MANESENIILHFKRTESNGCIQMIEKSFVEMEKMNVEPKEPNSYRRVVGLMASRPVENHNTIDGTAYEDNQTKNISSLGDIKSKVVGNSTESQYYNYHQYATNFVHSLQT